jgi:hypothetical protein
VVQAAAVLVEQKQSTTQAAQATHRPQAHHKEIAAAHHLGRQLQAKHQAQAAAVQAQPVSTLDLQHRQQAAQEHHQALTETRQAVRAVVVVQTKIQALPVALAVVVQVAVAVLTQ